MIAENVAGVLSPKWYYPGDIASDLDNVDLAPTTKAEILACAWEYSRSVIPQYTNWKRYVAFMRIIIIGTIAEFRGSLFDMVEDADMMLGYSLDQVLQDLFEDTMGAEAMFLEYKTFLTVTSEKTSERRHGKFFQNYTEAISSSPENWFRLRDCDALCRFTIAAALVCNDIDDHWFSEEQWNVLSEIGDTLYDAVAFFKHRAEGETNNTFAYVPEDVRVRAYAQAREALWALDVTFAQTRGWPCIINMLRFFGGPIHMTMRRYRFVEEGLTIGKPEDDAVREDAKMHVKLWHRLDFDEARQQQHEERLRRIFSMQHQILFPGFVGILEQARRNDISLSRSGVQARVDGEHPFRGRITKSSVAEQWKLYVLNLEERVKCAFPEVVLSPGLPANEVKNSLHRRE